MFIFFAPILKSHKRKRSLEESLNFTGLKTSTILTSLLSTDLTLSRVTLSICSQEWEYLIGYMDLLSSTKELRLKRL